MEKKSSVSSRPGKLVSVKYEDIMNEPLSKEDEAEIKRLGEEQRASWSPEFRAWVDERRAAQKAASIEKYGVDFDTYRPVKKTITTYVDVDVLDWLKSKGPGYQTRINLLLREGMVRELKKEKARSAQAS